MGELKEHSRVVMGGGYRLCGKCGETVFGSAVHLCKTSLLSIGEYAKKTGYSRAYIHKLVKAGRIATIAKTEVVLYIPEGAEIKPSKRGKGRPKIINK